MRRISREEIAGVRMSVDPSGVLFEHDDRLLRAFRPGHDAAVRALVEWPGRHRAHEVGLVDFDVADVAVEGFDLVVEVRRIPRVTYPTEWPTEALRDAALCILELSAVLAELGLGIHDPHPWNVLFDGPRPVFVDLGSLVVQGMPGPEWRHELRRHLLAPLWLQDRGWHRVADYATNEHPTGLVKSLLDHRPLRRVIAGQADSIARRTSGAAEFHRALADWVGNLDASGTPMEWSAYEQGTATVGSPSDYTPKQRSVHDFLAARAPATVLDVAANRGWYSRLACSLGASVVATDIDDIAIGALHRQAADEHLDVLALRLDLVWPKGSYGLALAYGEPYERIRCDVALALALVHHLVRSHDLRFETIASLLDRVARDAVLVEFIPRDDAHVATWGLGDWYREEAFVEALGRHFPTVERLASSPEPRVLLACSR